MADDSIRTLFNNLDELKREVTEIKVILNKIVLDNQEKVDERLDRHSKRIKELEDARQGFNSIKSFCLALLGCTATAVTIILGAINLMER